MQIATRPNNIGKYHLPKPQQADCTYDKGIINDKIIFRIKIYKNQGKQEGRQAAYEMTFSASAPASFRLV